MATDHDSAPLDELFAPFTLDDRKRLVRFARKAEELAGSRFAQSKPGLNVTMIPGESVLGGQAWEIKPSGPDQEAVKAVIGDFRQLWTDHRPTSAMSVLKILRGSAKRRGSAAAAELVNQLEAFRRRLAKRKSVDPRGKVLVEEEFGQSREMAPEEIIDSWLNGEYLHDDLDKADELALGEGSGMAPMSQLSLQIAIHDFITYWAVLANLVIKVLDEPALDATAEA